MPTVYETVNETVGDSTNGSVTNSRLPRVSPANQFTPLSPQEIARRLAALEAFGPLEQASTEHDDEAQSKPLDMSGGRGEFYGYTAREDAQR